jgi:hypothetical protein
VNPKLKSKIKMVKSKSKSKSKSSIKPNNKSSEGIDYYRDLSIFTLKFSRFLFPEIDIQCSGLTKFVEIFQHVINSLFMDIELCGKKDINMNLIISKRFPGIFGKKAIEIIELSNSKNILSSFETPKISLYLSTRLSTKITSESKTNIIHYLTGILDYLFRTILNGLILMEWLIVTPDKIYNTIALNSCLHNIFYNKLGENPYIQFINSQQYHFNNTIETYFAIKDIETENSNNLNNSNNNHILPRLLSEVRFNKSIM